MRRSRSSVATAASLLSLGVMVQEAQAYKSYVALIPNAGNIAGYPAIGHPDAAGEEGVNDFGTAFATAGDAWTTALCQADTDGDGYTNGAELGDPCCTWTASNTAGLITTGVSHPSDASLTPTNAALKAGCASTSTTTTGTTTAGSGANGTTTTGGDDDAGTIVAPVSTTVTPGATPADDDEDDADESAVLTADAASPHSPLTSVMVVAASAMLALMAAW